MNKITVGETLVLYEPQGRKRILVKIVGISKSGITATVEVMAGHRKGETRRVTVENLDVVLPSDLK